MKAQELLDQIFGILYTVKEDKNKLEIIHRFLLEEIYEEPENPPLPDKYKKAVTKIAEHIDAGDVCYFNPDTLEIEDIPQTMIDDPEGFESMTGVSLDDEEMKYQNWDRYFVFEPPESFESFKIMEHFVDEVDDEHLQNQLVKALNRRKPFAGFKAIVESSRYRQQWFDFKKQWMENHVKDLLLMELERERKNDPEEKK